jgi:SAM-dependent methyltransferase
MAKRLEPYKPKRILDIGSGDGKGVAALWNLFRCELLISLDENPECLEIAKRRLENLGASPNVIRRMDVEMKSEKKYLLKVSTGKLPKSNGTYFIESDVLADPELEEFLERIPLFDAITIWLMGTHLMRQNCLNLAQLQMTSNGEYRLRVQNKIYEMADKILRPGGVLQVVDRGEEPNTEYLRTETIAGHKDQASVTSLEVQDMEYMPYTELESGNHVSMVKTIGKDGPVRDIQRFAVISVIAIKPG